MVLINGFRFTVAFFFEIGLMQFIRRFMAAIVQSGRQVRNQEFPRQIRRVGRYVDCSNW